MSVVDLEVESAPAGPPPLGVGGFLRWCWRQLTSMRIALVLLFLLAIASVPGSILPQRGTDPILVQQWIDDAPTWGPILDRFGFFDVYASPWFAATYLLLFVSVIGCVLPRTAQHVRALRSAPPRAPSRLDRLPEFRAWTADQAAPEDVLDVAEADLRRRRWRVARGADWVAAERGYARETGNLVFHAALIALLLAIAYGALLGWRGNVIVREGSGFSNTLTQYDAWGGGRLANAEDIPPFSFVLDDFRVEFERGEAQQGAPRLFEADVTLTPEPGAPDVAETIRVNEPIAIDGAKVFLVGHGYAPRVIVRDTEGRVVFDDAVPFLPQDGALTSTGVIKVPDADPQIGIQGLFLPTAAVDDVRGPHSTFPDADAPALFLSLWTGDLGLDSGVPQSIYSLDTTAMEQAGLRALVPGDSWEVPGAGTVEFVDWQRWASFQIAHDPGKEAALGAAVLAMIGLTMSLFIKRRRLWVRVAEGTDAGTTVISVAALARSEDADLAQDVAALAEALPGGIAADPTNDAKGTP